MDVLRFTRQLVDIDSTTGSEAAVGEFLLQELTHLGFRAEAMPVEATRFNVTAKFPNDREPQLFISTHMDTVPPFIASSEDEQNIYGRGACDAKGIIAAQISAALLLRSQGVPAGLLFTVGEERDSIGALEANKHSPKPRFMINGEPTDSKLAVATKGALRLELIARGRMAHSAYPELGESAIEKLVRSLGRLL
jgi:acetylornithine deacetylase